MSREDAIYVRQSVDRADSISIESQIEFCRYETRGGPHRIYEDKGYSGKNTDRPQFQRMLEDIRRGEISRVICYKLDRCSRSILDFANMLEELQKYKVEFVSCTEKFDTSSPVGRAMLNICIVFAQLERETIQQRVSDAYHSRSQKGFYMGGRIPYGYRLEPYILQGKKTSRYTKCPDEADILLQIFTLYAQPRCSIGDVVKYLDSRSIPNSRSRNGHWSRSYIHSIMKNPIYVRADLDVFEYFSHQGANMLNPPEDYIGTNGCYLFTDKGRQSKEVSVAGHSIVLAPHEGIIPAGLWLDCRRKCLKNKQSASPTKAKHTWLAGKVKCGLCGYAMVIRCSGSRRYYMCSRHLNSIQSCPGVGGIPAEELEAGILDELTKRVRALGGLSSQREAQEAPRIQELRVLIARNRQEAEALLSKLPEANGAVMAYINQRTDSLNAQREAWKQELAKAVGEKKAASGDGPEVKHGMEHWSRLTLDDRIIVADALIQVIRVERNRISVFWRL